MSSFWEVTIILVLLIFNGFLSMTEIALVSARKARLRQWADEGDKAAELALATANSPTEFLSAVQVGITLVGILAGAFAGATISHDLAEHIKKIPLLVPYADGLAMGVVVSLVTYLSLIVGELVPKRLALNDPEKTARLMAPPITFIVSAFKPFVAFLSASTQLALRLMGVHERTEPTVTEAEIQVMVEQAAEAGIFEEAEQELVASVLRLDDRRVTAVMIPRVDLDWLDLNTDMADILETVRTFPNQNIPVARESLDELEGLVDIREIALRALEGKAIVLEEMVKPPTFVPENMTALELLDRFRESRVSEVFVMDEYGTLLGMVTRDHLFEAIVGEVPLEGESLRWQVANQEDGSWLIDAQIPIDLFCEKLDVSIAPEDQGNYQTLAGLVLTHLNRIPEEGDILNWDGLVLKVVQMDNYKIQRIHVERASQSDAHHDTAAA